MDKNQKPTGTALTEQQDVLDKAARQYREYLDLAALADLSKIGRAEPRAHNPKTPLSLTARETCRAVME